MGRLLQGRCRFRRTRRGRQHSAQVRSRYNFRRRRLFAGGLRRGGSGRVLGPILGVPERFHLFPGKHPPAVVHSVAAVGGPVPRRPARHIGVPEGPGAALEGADRIDGAASTREPCPILRRLPPATLATLLLRQEDAVILPPAVAVFFQAELAVHLAAVLLHRLLRRKAQELRQPDHFLPADPDEPWGAGAAVAALGAGEFQSPRVPGLAAPFGFYDVQLHGPIVTPDPLVPPPL